MTRHLRVAEKEGLYMLDELGMGVMVLFWITGAFNEMVLFNTKKSITLISLLIICYETISYDLITPYSCLPSHSHVCYHLFGYVAVLLNHPLILFPPLQFIICCLMFSSVFALGFLILFSRPLQSLTGNNRLKVSTAVNSKDALDFFPLATMMVSSPFLAKA